MAASITNDPFTAIWIHPVPAQLSIEEFAGNLEAVADALLVLPIAQKNLLKYDLVRLATM
jgi:hypothetical protein